MSSLLIKNMEKPNCYDCPMMKCRKCKGGQAYCVEISKPHGRLIDADKLKRKLEKHRDMCGDIELAHGIDEVIRILGNAPTIIEREVDANA